MEFEQILQLIDKIDAAGVSSFESTVSPARSTNAFFGKSSFLVPRQDSMDVSSFSEMPEKS